MLSKGKQFLEEKKYQEAKEQFDSVLQLSPQSAPFKLLAAEAMIGLKKFSEASQIAT